jgi:hypothetical protein
MIFSVAIDAQAIKECNSYGKAGLSVVASLLNSLDQNCILIESRKSDFSLESLINEVEKLAKSYSSEELDLQARVRLGSILTKLRISNRVKSVRIEDSSDHTGPAREIIILSLVKVIDQLILPSACDAIGKTVSLLDYAISPFEWLRSRACSEGISMKNNDCHISDLLNKAFKTLLMWSEIVHLIDYSLGQNWWHKNERNTNYTDAIPHWCSFLRSLKRDLVLVIRTLLPRQFESEGQDCKSLVAEIEQEFMSNLINSGIQVKVEISDKVHSRFLHSCGFFIDIDRGIDICFENGSVRRTSFGFKCDKKLETELR